MAGGRIKEAWLGSDKGRREAKLQDLRAWAPLAGQTNALYGSAWHDKVRALMAVRQAGATGQRIVSRAGAAAQRGISAAAASDRAADAASARERGVAVQPGSIEASSGSDQRRAREDVSASFADLRGRLGIQDSAAAAGMAGDAAAFQNQWMQQSAAIQAARAEAMRRILYGRSGGFLTPFATVVGGVIGGIYGGWGGAVGGAKTGNTVGGAASGQGGA